ncbi:nitroreductase family protein [Amedibacillus sp. YH-ame10]
MDFITLEKTRYAVRDYEDKTVEDEKLQLILEAGRIAPTAANRQSQRICIVRKEDMDRFDGAINFHGAPMALIVCTDTKEAWVRGYDEMNAGVIDASIVTTHMMLEATQVGLGSLWVCSFDPVKLSSVCGLKEGVIPVNVLCLGYAKNPADTERFTKTRKALEETILEY